MRLVIALAFAVASTAACMEGPLATVSPSPTVGRAASQVVAAATPSGKGTWTADTGINGTFNHWGNPPFGPPAYICGVGYNLAYAGGAPLVSVNVAALFPDSFAAHVTPETVDRAIGWQQPAAAGLSSSAIHDAAWLSRLGGAMGAICRSGSTDLDSLRGTLLKVSWETIQGSYEQEFQIDEITAEMTACGAEDGRIRIVWADPRSC
jgi:hypothetical protein